MKKLTLSFCVLVALGSVAFAGTETYSKESKSVVPPPCPQWYADNEFNLSLWGTYAPTLNGRSEDTYLIADHAWGGGTDLKYFFHRYFGIGLQGYVLFPNSDETFENGLTEVRVGGDNKRTVGSVLGTFTLRFPIGCSRFAPYVWVGAGGIFGGGQGHELLLNSTIPPGPPTQIVDHEFPVSTTRAVGQVGGGFEIRFTPHMGLLNDFSWNVVSGSNNNFGMARTGINFAF
jgi:hypothetical protein